MLNSSDPLYLIIEHRSSSSENNLRVRVGELQAELAALRRKYDDVVMRYGAEVHYNSALVDLLRENGIRFRDVFSHDFRYRHKDE